MKTNQLLVSTDLSLEALRPLGAVVELAERIGMEITLLHVVEDVLCAPPDAPLPPPVVGPAVPERLAQAKALLEDEARRLGGRVPVRVDAVFSGDVPRTIAAYADEHDMAMIALSTHGRSGFRRLVMGSIAENVIRHAHVPVLIVPPPSDE